MEIRGIHNYISYKLLSPKTANKQTQRILDGIKSLSEMPKRNPLYEKEPWKGRGLRKLIIDNYTAFYWTNDKTKEVVVFHVFYGGSNISELIK
ncbi:MAG: type II toxin-antitoxin system RelE/ParE family toxin [Clostridia bacterium]|nr:type II toxin-antitoxin system RelE/ParE family toxin [Clostridia bacterium]